MARRLIVFGITMATGGIEVLMRHFILDCKKSKKFNDITIVSSYPQISFETEYKTAGVNVLHIPSRRQTRHYKKELERIITKLTKNDLAYVNLSTYCNWSLLSALKKAKCSVIIHGHNAHVYNIAKKILHRIGRFAFRKIGYKISVSEECSEFMFGRWQSKTVSNGIKSNDFIFDFIAREKVRNRFLVSEKKYLIGCVGRISKEKNQKYLVNLSKRYSDCIFLFIGDFMNENYKKRLLKIAPNNCVFIGNVSNVGYYLSGMDALIVPSKREAFPLVAAEAFTNGLPTFFLNSLSKKLPCKILSNKFCNFIISDQIDSRILSASKTCRNANDVRCDLSFDISHFLKEIYYIIDNEVFDD